MFEGAISTSSLIDGGAFVPVFVFCMCLFFGLSSKEFSCWCLVFWEYYDLVFFPPISRFKQFGNFWLT